jgi:aquaporin related protein
MDHVHCPLTPDPQLHNSLLLAAEKHKATFLAPIGIGLALFIAEMVGVYYTGGSLNPARSFGPAVVLTTFSSYHWIYWLGPAMGATLAAGFYKFMKYLEYETVLGPEPDGENPVPPHGAVVPGAASGDVLDHGDEKKGPMMRAMGPGVGDLLTHGEPSAVSRRVGYRHAT